MSTLQSALCNLQSPQEELMFSSVKSHALFPGRTSLRVEEVACHLHITAAHVIDLIAEGRLGAVNVAGDCKSKQRNHWRVPVSAFDAFVEANKSL